MRHRRLLPPSALGIALSMWVWAVCWSTTLKSCGPCMGSSPFGHGDRSQASGPALCIVAPQAPLAPAVIFGHGYADF